MYTSNVATICIGYVLVYPMIKHFLMEKFESLPHDYNSPMYTIFLCAAADSPNGLTAERVPQEPRSFRVSWTPPASSTNLTGYRIYYSGADDSGSVDVGASATEVTIDSRKPGVTYSITMVALSPHLPSPGIGPVSVTLPGEYFTFAQPFT